MLAWHSEGRSAREYLLYVGTYTGGASKGIYACRFSAESAALSPMGLVAETVNPSFLCVHPGGRSLYALSEISRHEEQSTGLVTAYAIDRKAGALVFLNKVPSCGAGPCHISTDNTGRSALIANYAGGSVTAIGILNDGSLGSVRSFLQHSDSSGHERPGRRPHAHGAFVSGDNRFAVVPDLGLDRLFIYKFDEDNGTFEPVEKSHVDLELGAGPRHFAFHPSGRYGYVICETDSTVRAFHCDRVPGSLRQFDVVSTLPPGYRGSNSAAEVQIDKSGRFLYASNRGADNIAVFAIGEGGSLELVEHAPTGGKTPRHFAIDPSGFCLLVANQDTGNIVLFCRDQTTGRLANAGQRISVDHPACIVFVPAD